MRRSRSYTNIPLPKGKERTRSLSRTGVTGRNPSLDRKMSPIDGRPGFNDKKLLSAQKKSYLTPTTSNYGGLKRSGSCSSMRQSGTLSVSPKEMKMKQKQLNDKKWVAEQHAKCQHFIKTSGLFDPRMADSIKPPTISIFVQLLSTLLKEIFPVVNINTQNFADVVVSHLKLLRYPGSLTISGVKSGNTMHGFPQFITIVSFLIDKINPQEYTFSDELDNEFRITYNLQESILNFLTTNYQHLDQAASEPIVVEEFQTELSEILSIDNEKQEKLKKENELLKADIAETDKKLENLLQNKMEILNDLENKQKVIDEFRADDGQEDINLAEQIVETKEKIIAQKAQELEKKELIKCLKEQILAQPCQFKEKKELLHDIEEKKRYIVRRKETFSEILKIRDNLDHQQIELIKFIEKEVDEWNILIMKTFLPEMEQLQLRSRGFHSPAFLEEITEQQKARLILEPIFQAECDQLKKEIAKLTEQQEQITDDVEINEMTISIQNLQIEIEKTKREINKVSELILKEENNMKTFIDQVRETWDSKISQQEEQLRESELKLQEVEKCFEETGKNCVESIMEAHRVNVEVFKRLDVLLNTNLEKMPSALTEQKKKVEEKCNYLLDLYETANQIAPEWNNLDTK